MFLHQTTRLTVRRWAPQLAVGVLLLTSSALCLTGCAGSKPADDPAAPASGAASGKAPAGSTATGGAALAPDAGAAKDQAILKETAQEKNPDGKGP